MKKKSIAARLGVAALALTLVTTSLSAGTWAKYTEAFGVSGTFTVARWNVAAAITQNQDGTGTEGTNVWTMKSKKAYNVMNFSSTMNSVVDGSKIASGKIAPGASGQFYVQVYNSGTSNNFNPTEVLTDYEVYAKPINGTTMPKNFTMNAKLDGDSKDPEKVTFTDNDAQEKYGKKIYGGTLKMGTQDNPKVLVEWEWPYETGQGAAIDTNDANDVADGKAALKAEFEFYVVFTQQNPNPGT